jgi:hypothetical protein
LTSKVSRTPYLSWAQLTKHRLSAFAHISGSTDLLLSSLLFYFTFCEKRITLKDRQIPSMLNLPRTKENFHEAVEDRQITSMLNLPRTKENFHEAVVLF